MLFIWYACGNMGMLGKKRAGWLTRYVILSVGQQKCHRSGVLVDLFYYTNVRVTYKVTAAIESSYLVTL